MKNLKVMYRECEINVTDEGEGMKSYSIVMNDGEEITSGVVVWEETVWEMADFLKDLVNGFKEEEEKGG